jgi:hypothetical protein
MFERAGRVNARFAGGSLQPGALMAALVALGLEERQITIVKRADPGGYRAPEAAPGLLTRLLRRLGGAATPPDAPVPDALLMVYLGNDSEQAASVQAVLQRFAATQVDYYPAGRVITVKSDVDEHARFSAAFPDAEQRRGAPNAATPGGPGVTP